MSNAARENAAKFSNPDASWAIYAQLSRVDEVSYYTFKGVRSARVKIDLSVPLIESERDFGVAFALIGAGLSDDAAVVQRRRAADASAAVLFFAGGPMGSGKQYVPWIHIADENGAIKF